MNLLSSLFETAKNEWGATNLSNPVSAVKRPRDGAARERRLTPVERHQLLSEAAKLANSLIHLAILIALKTGMRQGEILKLQWDDIDLGRDIISVRDRHTLLASIFDFLPLTILPCFHFFRW